MKKKPTKAVVVEGRFLSDRFLYVLLQGLLFKERWLVNVIARWSSTREQIDGAVIWSVQGKTTGFPFAEDLNVCMVFLGNLNLFCGFGAFYGG